jgi:glycosyltransferase involved in cell wall biosynthesis
VTDLAVVGQDPRFGGGALAQMNSFLDAARALGRDPELLYVPHPTLRPDEGASLLDQVEALRLLRGSRLLVPRVRAASAVWVVATLAHHGAAASRAGRPYTCWIGTSLTDERRGRMPGLRPSRRLAAYANAPALTLLERTVLRRARRVFATSPASRAAVARAGGLDPELVGILPLPVDVDRFIPEEEEAWLSRLDAPLLTVVGRADDPRRNLGLALAALPLIRARAPRARLRIIGPRPPRELPAGTEALGEVPDVAPLLREASLLVLPSRQEGFGIAAAEALASGVPVVATPSGGPEALLRDSRAGVVLDGWSPEELAERTLELLGDAATLAAMRRRGRDYVVREHSPGRLRERLGEVLD